MKAMKTIEERKANYTRIENLVNLTLEKVSYSTYVYEFEKSYTAVAKLITCVTGEKVTAKQVADWDNDWYDLAMAKEI